MFYFFKCMGPVGPIMLAISIAILVLTVSKALQAFGRGATDRAALERGLDAILFWGLFCFVLGLLGQFTGHYKSLSIIITAEVVNPKMVFMGLAEALTSSIAGMTVLLLSSLVWFILRSQVRRRLAQVS